MRTTIIALFLTVATFAAVSYARNGSLTTTSSKVTAFTVSCATTATAIKPASGLDSYTSLRCGAVGTTAIHIGGSTVTTAQGYPVCTTAATCPENAISMTANLGYCIVAAATETLNCIAISD